MKVTRITLAVGRQKNNNAAGFTLLELAVIVSVILMLFVMLFPAYGSSRSQSRAGQCSANLRRLSAAWLMYAADNMDRTMSSAPVPGTMDWTASQQNTNAAGMVDSGSLLGAYMKDARLLKCPADTYQSALNPGPRVRSYSFNAALGSSSIVFPPSPYPPGRIYFVLRKLTDGPRLSELVLVLDEHPDSINDSLFMFEPGRATASYAWRDLPGSHHEGAAFIAFADGHCEQKQWQDDRTIHPVRYEYKWWGTTYAVPNSLDYQWMNDRMPYRQ